MKSLRPFWPLVRVSGILLCLGELAECHAQQLAFEDVTAAAGLLEPLQGIMGHGAAFGDVDGDGLLDLYVGGFSDRPDDEYAPATGPKPNVLLRNRGDGGFEPWPQKPATFFARTSGAVFADLDNDGDPDLYVANNCKGNASRDTEPQRTAQRAYSKLFRNDAGVLHDISKESGACPESLGTARNIGVFDYNGDGLLDLFLVEDRFTKDPCSVLFENLGGLRFAAANAKAGLPDDIFGLGLAVADINGDARPDFFVGHSNRLFLSTGDNGYKESPELNATFAWDPLDGEDWPCGAAFGDLNRDGLLDLVVSIHGVTARNKIYLNRGLTDGEPRFLDVTAIAGLPTQLNEKSPHVEIQDFDNDGWPDIYLSTAWLHDDGTITPLIYRNLGTTASRDTPRFEASFRPEALDSGKLVYFPAGPSGDYDNDGRLDLFLVNWYRGNHSRLLRNTSNPENHWLTVRVHGRSFNRDGIGTRIRVFVRNGEVRSLIGFQELGTGYGYASGQDTACHFGLGSATTVDLEIRFPNGSTIRREGVETLNQTLTIEE